MTVSGVSLTPDSEIYFSMKPAVHPDQLILTIRRGKLAQMSDGLRRQKLVNIQKRHHIVEHCLRFLLDFLS